MNVVFRRQSTLDTVRMLTMLAPTTTMLGRRSLRLISQTVRTVASYLPDSIAPVCMSVPVVLEVTPSMGPVQSAPLSKACLIT